MTNNLESANIARRFTSLGYGGVGAGSAKITKDDIQSTHLTMNMFLWDLITECQRSNLQ